MPVLVPDVLAREYPRGEAVPVVFDSPHSGRRYPADFGHIAEELQLRRAEDAYLDELYVAAPEHGATLIHALFPRSYIDPNRGEDEIDQTMLDAPWPQPLCASAKTELGLSLIWRLYAPGKPMYARRLCVAEVERRHSLLIKVNRKALHGRECDRQARRVRAPAGASVGVGAGDLHLRVLGKGKLLGGLLSRRQRRFRYKITC